MRDGHVDIVVNHEYPSTGFMLATIDIGGSLESEGEWDDHSPGDDAVDHLGSTECIHGKYSGLNQKKRKPKR